MVYNIGHKNTITHLVYCEGQILSNCNWGAIITEIYFILLIHKLYVGNDMSY